jgi:BirA family biotin operon repressor/biotin-[acetyl-CoA-carboxylase] ligase
MRTEILELLRNTNEYVSGQELCERFGVSRTAVWKAIDGLKKDGYNIVAVRNRGYRLITDFQDIFSERELVRSLRDNKLVKKVCFFESIGSTNTEAKKMAEDGEESGVIVAADMQTSGRGRRGRTWISPDGRNVYFTLMLKPEFAPDRASMLTIIMALSVARSISYISGGRKNVSIKWPNDILIDGKKVCGILTEMSVENYYIQYVVIGVGINVKQQEFSPEVSQNATSIDAELGGVTDRSGLVGNIMRHFDKIYSLFLKTGDLSEIREEYENFLINKGREVCILDPAGEYRGRALAITDTGELVVEKSGGEIVNVYAGEVSVRGIYGYV